jgi:hypothetical protein
MMMSQTRGDIYPDISLASVVFPPPLGPTSAVILEPCISREKFSKIEFFSQ